MIDDQTKIDGQTNPLSVLKRGTSSGSNTGTTKNRSSQRLSGSNDRGKKVDDLELTGTRIFVTGVTGTLGARVARRLVPEALEVRGLIRNADQLAVVEQLGFTPVLGDLPIERRFDKRWSKIDWVVHCAAYLGEDAGSCLSSRMSKGSITWQRWRMKRGHAFVHISTTSVYGEPAAGQLTESSPLAVDHSAPYIETKIRSEHILNEYASARTRRPHIYGPAPFVPNTIPTGATAKSDGCRRRRS